MYFAVSRTPDRGSPMPYNHAMEQSVLEDRFRDRPMTTELVGNERNLSSEEDLSSEAESLSKADGVSDAKGISLRKNKPQQSFPYRSKQKKIDRVHKNISQKFSELGLFAAEKELVRGDDCLRIHVKNFNGLNEITEALNGIPDEGITISRLAAVYSKKNKYQHKGLIFYLRLGSIEERERCEEYLAQFTNLKQIAVARKKSPSELNSGNAKVDNGAPKHFSKDDVENELLEIDVPEVPTRRLSIAGS